MPVILLRHSGSPAHCTATRPTCVHLAVETTGAIEEVVEDKSGAVLPGVKLTLINDGTGESREFVTATIGRFVFPDLPVGTYRITAEKKGFKTFTQIRFRCELRNTLRFPSYST